MTTRTPLDLRGKTMTELMELDARRGDELSAAKIDLTVGHPGPRHTSLNRWVEELLADRRQIREEMERRRDADNANGRAFLRMHRSR